MYFQDDPRQKNVTRRRQKKRGAEHEHGGVREESARKSSRRVDRSSKTRHGEMGDVRVDEYYDDDRVDDNYMYDDDAGSDFVQDLGSESDERKPDLYEGLDKDDSDDSYTGIECQNRGSDDEHSDDDEQHSVSDDEGHSVSDDEAQQSGYDDEEQISEYDDDDDLRRSSGDEQNSVSCDDDDEHANFGGNQLGSEQTAETVDDDEDEQLMSDLRKRAIPGSKTPQDRES